MGIDQYDDCCQTVAVSLGVCSAIHFKDYIFDFLVTNPSFPTKKAAIDYYFRDGQESVKKLDWLLTKVCDLKSRAITLLEFASGYGCVTRHFGNTLPNASITACDIHSDAVHFVSDRLGTEAVQSSHLPEDLHIEGSFDVVFALSFFSHMPKETFSRWLKQLASVVCEGGYLIFTTHGLVSKRCYVANCDLDSEGFWFTGASEQKDLSVEQYGLTVSSPRYVLEQIYKLPCELKYFHEAYWWNHQDVFVVKVTKVIDAKNNTN